MRDREMETQFNPYTVDGWEESADHLTFTVHLHPDLRWHDGEPWTAHDVEFTWRLIRDEQVVALFYELTAARLADVRALDDTTVQFVHREVRASRMRDMYFPVLPRHIWDRPEIRAKDPTLRFDPYWTARSRERVVGSGAYRLVEWKQNERLVLDRWHDYALRRPRFERQVLEIVPDGHTALLLFRRGELDETPLSAKQFVHETGDDAFRRVGVKAIGPWRQVMGLAWNQDGSNPFFGDVRVRRAMSHAFHRDQFLHDALYDLCPPSLGIFDREHYAHDPTVEPFAFDLGEAARLLDEAGWRIDEETGWRYREVGGRRVKFEFEMLVVQGNPVWLTLLDIYVEDLRRLGVVLRPRFVDSAGLAGALREHDFQSYIGLVEGTNTEDWPLYWSTSARRDGYNYVAYSSPRVDELFERALSELDSDRRRPLYQEIQRVLYGDVAWTFVYDLTLLWAFNHRLGGVEMSPSGPILFYPGVGDWWLRAAGGSGAS
jgi:peptide/nickel transport system substrate-binding protein